MRKQVKSSLLLLSAAAFAYAEDNTLSNYSHTFLTIRPVFQGSMPEKVTLWRDRALARDCGYGGAFQVVPLGGQSTAAADLGRYFMFNQKNTLTVAGSGVNGINDTNPVNNPYVRDVEAINFNIQPEDGASNTFKSQITFKPRHTFAGVGLDYKQYLHGRDACEKKWWMEISSPILYVRNDMRLTESPISDITAASGAYSSMTEAFKGTKQFYKYGDGSDVELTGSIWNYGKINGANKARVRPADIEFKIGYDYLCEEMCHAEGYIGGLIPTGNRPKGEYVFESIVGYNFNGGLLWGGSFGWQIWSSCDRYLHIEMETQSRYLFQNSQYRSFDVIGKPWSRYMLVYEDTEAATNGDIQYGINVFTRKVKVAPRYSKDFNAAFVYTSGGFQGELGYNFWTHTAERVKLASAFPTEVRFVGLAANGYPAFAEAAGTEGATSRARTIGENFSQSNIDYEGITANQAIRQSDLDLNSAATPSAITNIFYGSLGYRFDNWCYPMFVGLGGSYELASDFGAISRWTVWGKIGVSI